jgi:pimeloyl-ACP methyl ester carboxylesterase
VQWREESSPGRGIRLHVRQVVDPPAPAVLLLHGLGVGGSIWQSFARRLLPSLASVAPDLRGHADSDAPPDGYRPIDYAGDLVELIQNRLEPPVPVVGHSLGALVALELAGLRPDLVAWLALLDPPLDPDRPNTDLDAIYRLRHAPPGELESYLLEHALASSPLLAQSLARLFRQASDRAFEALASAPLFGVPNVEQSALVLQADPRAGGLLGDVAAQALVERLHHATLVKIPGAAHALHASHPAQVAEALLGFARSAGAKKRTRGCT